jgi:hypothetical protein
MKTTRQHLLEPTARLLVFGLAVALATTLAAILLRHPTGSIFEHIQKIAAWLKGGPKPEVVTWPAWGYAWLVAVLPSFGILVALQACVGTLALTALAGRLWNQMPGHRTLLTGMLLLAVPWYNMQVDLYPTALAGSLTLLALLYLDSALSKNATRGAFLAGTLAGLAQNFRTEFVLLPLFLGTGVAALRRVEIMKFPSFKPVWVFIVTALALQLPWAMFYHAQTGRFSLTESNFGHVLFASLGKNPRNPWGIKGDDEAAYETVRNAGYRYHYASLSEEGNQFLLRFVFQKAKEHPYGIAQRTFQLLKNTVLAPFNWGEPRLDEQARLDLDVLRQELKVRFGVGVNVRKLQDYRDRDLYPAAQRNRAAVGALIYQFCGVGLGSLVLLLGIAGMLLVLVRPSLRPETPLLYLLGCAACYKILQDVLLCYDVSYLSNVYPMFLPFMSISLFAIGGCVRSIATRSSGGNSVRSPSDK